MDLRHFHWVPLCRIFDLSKNKILDYYSLSKKKIGISQFELYFEHSHILDWKKRRVSQHYLKIKIKNGSGRWIYGISVGFNFVESLIYLKIKLDLSYFELTELLHWKKRRAPNII